MTTTEIYRVALENIENFAHTCSAHPEFLDPHFIRVAFQDIQLAAQLALQEIPEASPVERVLDLQ